MSQSFNLAENIVGGFESINTINDARNNGEMVVALQQGIGYLGAIALNPVTAGLAIATNAMAATATLGKILGDYNNSGKINSSDLGALAGQMLIISAAVALSINPISRVAAIASRIASGIGWIGISGYLVGNARASAIDSTTNTGFRNAAATRPPMRGDPLALDLDGDGIETLGAVSNPVLFDHNADGVKTGTGWLQGDDAWLVLDRDGNGLIDTGRELFGVDTLMSGTPGVNAVYAQTGFEALGTLDTNGDSLFNSQDAAFTQVRLWQDFNQDGVSQSNELFTLADKDIVSISLNATATNINLGNGNVISGTASVIRSSGPSTQAASVGINSVNVAANLDLASNPFYREFTTPVVHSDLAKALPEMRGSGWVRDLREAMSLGTTQSLALVTKVEQYASATTHDAQVALLDDLVRLWAATNQTQPLAEVNDPSRRFVVAGDPVATAKLQAYIPVLEVFNGMGVVNAGMQAPVVSTVNNVTVTTFNLFPQQVPAMLAAYEQLRQSVYGALLVQTRLQPYLDSIELAIDETGVQFDTSALANMLDNAFVNDQRNALIDLTQLNLYAFDSLSATGFDGMTKLNTWINLLPASSPLRAELANLNVYTGLADIGSSVKDLYLGDSDPNYFRGGLGDDVVRGDGGGDTFDGQDGADWLDGGDGIDVLRGGTGSDTLIGGAGNDTIYGDNPFSGRSVEDDDLLDGGTGNDWMAGGVGSDVYLFGLGDGQDTIDNRANFSGSQVELSSKRDAVRFKDGVLPADVTLRRSGDDLLIKINGTADQLRVVSHFYLDGVSIQGNAIDEVRFADGTVWTGIDIKAMVLVPTLGADQLTGYATNDDLVGLDGSDSLMGRAGNDVLDGGEGSDTMYGQEGNDSLIGDAGSDLLDGGEGNDTLKGGAGNDTIYGDNHFSGYSIEDDDLLEGGTGDDWLAGGVGSDVYSFGLGKVCKTPRPLNWQVA